MESMGAPAAAVGSGGGAQLGGWMAGQDLHREHRRKVSLVGWSLGGIYAREIARCTPQSVRQVVTLATPFAAMADGNHAGTIFKLLGGDTSQLTAELQARLRKRPPVPTTSIYSDNDRLTGHLKSPDFFDVEKHPTAIFETTSITGSGDNSKVTGKLTMHGETKEISFPAKIEVKDDAVTVQAEFSINRFDFNMKYPGKADDLIREGVVLRLDVKATPKQA